MFDITKEKRRKKRLGEKCFLSLEKKIGREKKKKKNRKKKKLRSIFRDFSERVLGKENGGLEIFRSDDEGSFISEKMSI